MKVGAFEILDPVPDLRDVCAIAILRPWVDVGQIGTLAMRRLEEYLGAHELGRLSHPGTFFDFTRYRPQTRIVNGQRVFSKPNSIIRYAKHQETQKDYLFLDLREPHSMGEAYADAIVTLLEHFNVTEYCRIGSMYDSVPHTRPLMVTGSLNEEQLQKVKHLVSPKKNTYEGPTSIVNLVDDTLRDSNLTITSLMVHVPQYVQLNEDYMGVCRILETIASLYEFPMSLASINTGQQQYLDIGNSVANNKQVAKLVEQLETYYDQVLSPKTSKDKIAFSPEVESFLTEMSDLLGNVSDDQI